MMYYRLNMSQVTIVTWSNRYSLAHVSKDQNKPKVMETGPIPSKGERSILRIGFRFS